MARTKKVEKVEVVEEKKFAAPTNYSLDLIIAPVITEKTMKLQSDLNTITVKVSPKANKTSIMVAFEQIFNVKPVSIRIVNVLPKAKRVGKYTGKTKTYKKAIITLAEGQSLDLLKN